MDRYSGWQRISLSGMILGFIAICVVSGAWVVHSLSESNQSSLGGWADAHSAAIWGFLVGAVPSVFTYFFGKRVAARDTLNAGVDAVKSAPNGAEAANRLRLLGTRHGLGSP